MRQKIKICHIQLLPLLSGVQRVMLDIFHQIDKNKYDITIICKEEGQLTKFLGQQKIKFITLPHLDNKINPLTDLKVAFALFKILKHGKFHLVHTHSTKPGFIGRLAAKLAGVPVIIHHVHGFGFHEFSNRLSAAFLSLLETAAALISDKVIFVNNEERRWALEKGVVSPEKAITIYNGVDLEKFNTVNNNEFLRKQSQKLLGIDSNDADCQVVGFIGRLWEQKDPQTAVEVARILIKTYDLKNLIFLIIGDGYLREKMEETADMYGIDGNVRFLGWRDDIDKIYPALDVVLLPSLWEGLPCTALEAMACGVPVVASDIKGNREVVVQYETGFLIPPKCAHLFASAVIRLLNDKELIESISKKARKRAEIFHNAEITAKETINLYETCLRDKGVLNKVSKLNLKIKDTYIKEPVLKRPFDLLLSISGIVLSFPLWLIIAVLIKLEDRDPIFYIQERWGKNRKVIKVYKFRSMVQDSDKNWENIQARDGDPRVTKVGKVLRKTALDELPQLINVLKGDMSFVGPRALCVNEVQNNGRDRNLPDEAIPGFHLRSKVRPGITGIAQIMAAKDVVRKNKFRYDACYIRKQSIWLDIKLLLLSFWITAAGKWESRENKVSQRTMKSAKLKRRCCTK